MPASDGWYFFASSPLWAVRPSRTNPTRALGRAESGVQRSEAVWIAAASVAGRAYGAGSQALVE